MAFPTDWTKKVEITIPAAQVGSGGVVDYSVVLTESSLPASIFTDAKADGSDVRASTGSDGSGQLAVDLIGWDDTGGTAQLRIGTLSLSSTVANSIWIWYGNAAATAPAAADTYGQHNAYDSGWAGYWPLDGDANDRTANGNDGTVGGLVSSASGQVGSGYDFPGGSSDHIDVGNPASLQLSEMSVLCWFRADDDDQGIVTKGESRGVNTQRDWDLFGTGSDIRWISTDGADLITDVRTTYPSTGAWHHVSVTWDGTTDPAGVALRVDNGTAITDTATGTNTTHAYNLHLGGRGDFAYDGRLDEVQIHSVARSSAWVTTEHNATSSPGTFATAGTPEDVGGATFQPAWANQTNVFVGIN